MSAFIIFILIRIVTGWMFVRAGYAKLSTERHVKAHLFEKIGLKPGSAYAALVGCMELLGGICMIFGVFTNIVGIILGLVILGAALVKLKDHTALQSRFELYLLWALVCFLIALLYRVPFI